MHFHYIPIHTSAEQQFYLWMTLGCFSYDVWNWENISHRNYLRTKLKGNRMLVDGSVYCTINLIKQLHFYKDKSFQLTWPWNKYQAFESKNPTKLFVRRLWSLAAVKALLRHSSSSEWSVTQCALYSVQWWPQQFNYTITAIKDTTVTKGTFTETLYGVTFEVELVAALR